MTDEQVEKARNRATDNGFHNVEFRQGYAENLPFEDGSFDAAISNGVTNLSTEKECVFEEVSRALKPDGRFALDPTSRSRADGLAIRTDGPYSTYSTSASARTKTNRGSSPPELAGG